MKYSSFSCIRLKKCSLIFLSTPAGSCSSLIIFRIVSLNSQSSRIILCPLQASSPSHLKMYLTSVLHQLDQKIIYPHYDFKHLTEKYFEIGMKLDDFLIQLVKYC